MTRTTRAATLAAAAIAGGAGIAIGVLGLHPPTASRPHEKVATVRQAAHSGPPSDRVPEDPELLAKYRQAYRDSLREVGAAGMLEVLQAADVAGKAVPVDAVPASPPAWEGAVMARVEDEGEHGHAHAHAPAAGYPSARLGVPQAPAVPGPQTIPSAVTSAIDGWSGPLPLATMPRTTMPRTTTPRATIREVSLTVPAPSRALVGTHPAQVESRLTLALPPGVRRQLGEPDEVLLMPQEEGCLCLAAPDTPPVTPASLTGAGDGGRQERRRLLARTARVALDSEGRLEVSRALAEAAGLKGNVVLIGCGDHFEVWDAARWEAARDKLNGP